MTSSFEQFLAADRRLAILVALQAAIQYRANALLLRAYCERVGHAGSIDRLNADLAWLAEQGLVLVEEETVLVATATTRGLDVASGLAVVPGVARPQPR